MRYGRLAQPQKGGQIADAHLHVFERHDNFQTAGVSQDFVNGRQALNFSFRYGLLARLLDPVYASLGISAQAVVGQASEIVPGWAGWIGAIAILAMSIKPVWNAIRVRFKPAETLEEDLPEPAESLAEPLPVVSSCCPKCDSASDSKRS